MARPIDVSIPYIGTVTVDSQIFDLIYCLFQFLILGTVTADIKTASQFDG